MYKILALDGGGLRSAFQARMIERIEEKLGRSISADLYAGTSGGAIVAAGLQIKSPGEIVEFFLTEGEKIFKPDNFIDDLEDLFDLTGARYDNKYLKKYFQSNFGDMVLGDFQKKILITSFALLGKEGWEPAVFHNFDSPKASKNLLVVDALCATSAAPTFFPVYQIPEKENKYIDGGVWGNNPSASALAAVCDKLVGNQPMNRISILSIGTGKNPSSLRGSKKDLGAYDWLTKGIIDILLDGNIEASHYYCRSFLGPSYHRVQPLLANAISIDDPKSAERMIDLANSIDLEPILSWMQGFWSL